MREYLRTKISAKFLLPVSISIFVIILIAGFLITNYLQGLIVDSAKNEASAVTNSIKQNLDITNSLMKERITVAMNYLIKKGKLQGAPALGKDVNIGGETVQDLLLGGKGITNNYSIVDEVKDAMQSTATIFVKKGDSFIRISTNVKDKSGNRAVGTKLDAKGKAYSEVSGGNAFYGVVEILGQPYITGYEPILNANKSVIGIWYVGYPISTLNALGEMISKAKFLSNGFFVLMDGKNKTLFSSSNASPKVLSALSAGNNKDIADDWVIEKTVYDKWGYTIVSAYPKDDVSSKITSVEITIVFAGIIIAALFIFVLLMIVNRTIIKPVKNLVLSADKLAEGSVDVEINAGSEDEIGELEKAFSAMARSIKLQSEQIQQIALGELDVDIKPRSKNDVLNISLLAIKTKLNELLGELGNITDSITDGKLSVRGNSDNFKGGYKEIVVGINNTLDAVIAPLNMAAEYVDRISKGDIPEIITEEYKGDFKEIKNNLNLCIDSLNGLISDMSKMYTAQKAGDIDAYIQAVKFQGAYRKMAEGVNDSVKFYVENILKMLDVLSDYSEGNLESTLEKLPGKQVVINEKLEILKTNLKNVINETIELTKSASAGELSVRGNKDKFKGAYKDVVEGINNILDSVVTPLEMAVFYIEKIGKGEIPEKITEDYKGEYGKLKDSINSCIEGLNGLIESSDVIEKMSRNDYTVTVKGNYQGIFAKTGNSVNLLINRLEHVQLILGQVGAGDLNKLEELKKLGKRSENDKLVPSFVLMMQSIKNLVDEINGLTIAASNGEISVRADASKYQGDFKEVINGVNNTLDAVVGPVNIAAAYVKKISEGDLSSNVTEEFKGEFNNLKESLNHCIKSIKNLIEDAHTLSTAAVEGDLSLRADAKKHSGDYAKIIQGVNDTLDAMTAPIKEGVNVLSIMATGDFTTRISSLYKGEHKLIKESINSVSDSLCEALQGVTEAVEATASASNQISSSTEEMAAGAHEQSQQTLEIAGGVDEMTKTILDNTKNASLASETAKEAGEKAHDGGKVVDETIEGMNRITEVVKLTAAHVQELGKESDQIGAIVQVIDDIAEQTNLLALNAAIEAARAGEQGRGFAVVADEVKKLSEKTSKATKEIETMIKQIQKDTASAVESMKQGTTEVEKGKILTFKAGESLKEIIIVSGKVVDVITQVAAASEEQSSAAEQISKNVETISSVSKETSSGTHQIAQAAEDLTRLTLNLENLIAKFKINEGNDKNFRKQIN